MSKKELLNVQINPTPENVLEYMDIINWRLVDYSWFLSYDTSLIRKILIHTSQEDGLNIMSILEVYLEDVEKKGKLEKKHIDVIRNLISNCRDHKKKIYKIIAVLRKFYKKIGGYSDASYNLITLSFVDLLNSHPNEAKKRAYLLEAYKEASRAHNGEVLDHIIAINPSLATKEGRNSEIEQICKINPGQGNGFLQKRITAYSTISIIVYSVIIPLITGVIWNSISDLPFDKNNVLKVFSYAIMIGGGALSIEQHFRISDRKMEPDFSKMDIVSNFISYSVWFLICLIVALSV